MARKTTVFQNHSRRVAIHTYGALAGLALTAHTHMLPETMRATANLACIGPALRSARRCDSLEECDDGFCEDVIPITGDHMGSVCHIDILGVRALFEETLGPCLT